MVSLCAISGLSMYGPLQIIRLMKLGHLSIIKQFIRSSIAQSILRQLRSSSNILMSFSRKVLSNLQGSSRVNMYAVFMPLIKKTQPFLSSLKICQLIILNQNSTMTSCLAFDTILPFLKSLPCLTKSPSQELQIKAFHHEIQLKVWGRCFEQVSVSH